MRSTVLLITSEAKMILREPADLVVPLGLPLVVLVMFGLQMRDAPPLPGGGSALDAVGLPVAIAMTIALIGIINMPTLLTGYPKNGVLRRFALTPVSPLRVLAAR